MAKQGMKADFKTYKDLLNSRAFSENFWNDRIVTCPNCVAQKKAQNNFFDFQAFLLHGHSGQFRVSSEELETILKTGKWGCKVCDYQFQIIQEPYPQFRWWSIRWNHPTGPNGVFIEKIPLYSLQKIPS